MTVGWVERMMTKAARGRRNGDRWKEKKKIGGTMLHVYLKSRLAFTFAGIIY